jgi:hypothetical protein
MVLQGAALELGFMKENMQVVCTVLCICMISVGCSYDQHIFRLMLKLQVHACFHVILVDWLKAYEQKCHFFVEIIRWY